MIKQILIPDTNEVKLKVPDNFIGREVEVIAFTIDDVNGSAKEKSFPSFEKVKIDTTGFNFDRDFANER
jgi:hypothetical protein